MAARGSVGKGDGAVLELDRVAVDAVPSLRQVQPGLGVAVERVGQVAGLEEQRIGRGDRLVFTSRTVRDVLYGVNSATNQIVAYDTTTWAERYRLNIGEDVGASTAFGQGVMAVSSDGRWLFLSTPSGVRQAAIRRPLSVYTAGTWPGSTPWSGGWPGRTRPTT